MYTVQYLDSRETWTTSRTFHDWHEAREHAYYLRLDGYDVRVIDA